MHFPEKHFKDGQILPKVDWGYVPKYLLSNKYYPSLVSGFAYVLPISTLDCLYEVNIILNSTPMYVYMTFHFSMFRPV